MLILHILLISRYVSNAILFSFCNVLKVGNHPEFVTHMTMAVIVLANQLYI